MRVKLLAVLIVFSNLAFGQGVSDADQAIIDASKAITNDPSSVLTDGDFALIEQSIDPAQQPSDFAEIVGDIAQQSRAATLDALQQTVESNPLPLKPKTAASIVLFASFSLDDGRLDQLLAFASRNQNAAVVFQGVPNPENILAGMQAVQASARRFDPMPNVMLDPGLFTEFNVTSVPTILLRDPASFDEVARIEGLTNTRYLNEAIEAGERGHIGRLGPVEVIAEVNLIDLLKERAAAIDWETKRAEAEERFWEGQRGYQLPAAIEDRVKYVDPSIRVTESIYAPDGQLLAPQGMMINPLEMVQFTQALVIFDPSDERQVHAVAARLDDLKANHTRVALIATHITPVGGWDEYTGLSNRLDSHIYTLKPDMITRFQVEQVPTIITANEREFIVTEVGVGEGES
ncbi:TrbC family F-type conjugative pilus assembly protein [uncultured Umboniibacter sp.]|uniref:TrbC family F-type conjugative pilus assembly protein n=1 Tax=uncultured Umboniibacter sp. TaxID=1798917 RepID=UPI002607C5A1|nr:TrbC family F-type conjugative pilus assembly protein [uncultured Umboniibacter sp.]